MKKFMNDICKTLIKIMYKHVKLQNLQLHNYLHKKMNTCIIADV